MSEQLTGRAAPPPRGAVRLIFEYEAQRLRLLSRARVDVLAPPTDPLTGYETHQGFWVEVRDSNDRTLHRRVMPDFTEAAVEVFSNEPGESLRRTPVSQPQGTFAVLVPDLDQADHLAVMGSPGGGGAALGRLAATELGRFPLSDDDQAGGA